MNLILEKTDRVRYFTNIQQIFLALGISASQYDWYVSDIETNYYATDFSGEDQWISGVELQNFLEKNDVQFISAVFSAFPIGYRCEVEQAPYADGNPIYWNGQEISPQIENAEFEIACWDSSATMLIGLPPELESNFKKA